MKTYGNVLTLYLTSLKNTKLESYSQRLVFQTVASSFASILPVCVILLPSWASSITFSPLLTKEHSWPWNTQKGFILSLFFWYLHYHGQQILSQKHSKPHRVLLLLRHSFHFLRGDGHWKRGGGWLEPNKDSVCGYSWGGKGPMQGWDGQLKVQNQNAVCSF